MWCVTIGSHQRQKIIKVLDGGREKKTEAVFSRLGDHCHHVSGIRQTYAGLLLLKPRRLAQAAVWEHERLCGMSRRTGPNSGSHCQGSWQRTPIVGQGKEFGYMFQRGPQLQTNAGEKAAEQTILPLCLHSNTPPPRPPPHPSSAHLATDEIRDSLPPDWTAEEA